MKQQMSLFAIGGQKSTVNWTKADPELLRRKDALAVGGPPGWRPNRLILMNYWHFTYEEFYFVQGRLVLRGSNGSGKSTALAAAITLTLDGEKRRERMDTFGGQGRSVAYYLVGDPKATAESDFFFHDRTAYVVVEFEHATQKRYASIGVGLYTSRGRPNLDVDFWGFTIGDGRRPGLDLPLFDITIDGRIPLTERQLRERIGPGGQVTDRQGEYQRMVNALLFGMPEEEYDDLLKVLVHLRSPKLNKDIKPSDVCQVLAKSLPSLKEDLLTQVTRIIEDIDSQQEILERTHRHLKAVTDLDEKLDRYLNQLAQQAALDYREARVRQETAQRELQATSEQVALLQHQLTETRTAMTNLAVQREEVRGRLDVLEQSPAFADEKTLEVAERDRNDAEATLKKAEREVSESQSALKRIGEQLERVAQQWEKDLASLQGKATDLAGMAEAAVWPTAADAVSGLPQALAGLRLDETGAEVAGVLAPILQLGRSRVEALQAALVALLELERAQAAHEAAQAALRSAEAHRDYASEQVTAAEDAVYDARDTAVGKLHEWKQGAREMSVASDAMTELVDAIREYPQNGADLPAVADRLGARLVKLPQEKLKQLTQALQTERAGRHAEMDKTDEELRSWLSRTDAQPKPREGQEQARHLLAVQAIPAVPLYAACDFRPGLDSAEAARLEAAMEDAGLLDALVVPTGKIGQAVQILTAAGLGDRWIMPQTATTGRTLADLLVPAASRLASADVQAVLRSVSLGGSREAHGAAVTTAGLWQIGPLQGAAGAREGARFIGLENRRRRREAEIERLRRERAAIAGQIKLIDDHLDELAERQEALENDREALRVLPAWAALRDKADALAGAQRWLDRCQRNVGDEVQRQRATYLALQEIKERLQAVQSSVPESRGRNSEGLRALIGATQGLLSGARTLAEQIDGLQRLREHWREAEGAREAEQKRLASALDRRKDDRAKFEQLKTRAEALLERLVGLDLKDMRRQIQELRRRIGELDGEEKRLIETGAKLGTKAESAENAATSARVEALSADEAEVQARTALVSRLRAYPTLEPYLERITRDASQALACADDLLKLRRTAAEGLRKAIDESQKEAYRYLSDAYAKYQSDLVDYRPELEGDLITFRDHGVRLLPCKLKANLEGDHQHQLMIVREKETELYEEFILRQVSSHIRELVGRVEDWRDRVNHLLKNRRLTNDEVLSIGWRPRPADRVTGVDMGRVVELLQQDPDKLPPESVTELIGHFRARVNEVRDREKRGEQEKTFADALAEVLDYRLWFEFTLHSKLPGQERQLVTDIRFTARSGAEKSLAMFIPLLAAAHARYETAALDAPKLVGLDEAFAGVDEQNTKEMFRFLVELNFSWIMTSEKLWGVAETLPGCATYELVRRGNVVTPIFYLWDGTRRHGSLESVLGEVAAAREE